MANSVIRIEFLKLSNIGNEAIICSVGGGQYLTANTTVPALSNTANTGVSVGFPVANNTGLFARVTGIGANAASVMAYPSNTVTFTEDLGVRIFQNQTVLFKIQSGSFLYMIQATQ